MRNILDPDHRPELRRRRRRPSVEARRHPGRPTPTPLAETSLPLRVVNMLEARGILTVEELGDVPDDVIAEYIKSGPRVRAEVYDLLAAHGRRVSKGAPYARRAD